MWLFLLGCLTYAYNFIKDLAKLGKLLQYKLKKEVSLTWTPSDSKIVQNFKKICKNLLVLILSNEEDDLILETDASNEHWSTVLKIKEREKLYKYYSRNFKKVECNYPTMKKEILTIRMGIEMFLIFLGPKSCLIGANCKEILGFVKKNLSNMQAQRRLLRWQLWLN